VLETLPHHLWLYFRFRLFAQDADRQRASRRPPSSAMPGTFWYLECMKFFNVPRFVWDNQAFDYFVVYDGASASIEQHLCY
jgi:hypothetical protein